jgi:glucose-6-phosphate dehydrogenase assembly protein OpcA
MDMSGLDTSQMITDLVTLRNGGETEAAHALEKDMAGHGAAASDESDASSTGSGASEPSAD